MADQAEIADLIARLPGESCGRHTPLPRNPPVGERPYTPERLAERDG